jgi:MOSC domain-containing protein YiiM
VARVLSVNVGKPREVSSRRGRPLMSAIFKAPVEGRLRVEGVNIAGDDQADRSVHGGPEKAVYAYAREDIDWWENIHGDLPNGCFGENLTTQGLDISGAIIGERWQVGSVVLEICQPRLPCSKLGIRFNDLRMVKAFARASRPGGYLRIIEEGELGVGDEVTVLARPDHGVTIAMCSDAVFKDPSLAATVLRAPQLSPELRRDLAEAA